MAKFAPEFYFYSGRGLAAGGIFPNPARTLQELQSQSVPIVIVNTDEYEEMRIYYARFYEHLDEHYRPVQESSYGGTGHYRVLVDKRLAASGTYDELSLPCYR